MYGSLPSREAIFLFDETDEFGIRYHGEFKVHCVCDIGTKHKIELQKTRLMADYANPSPGLIALAESIADVRGRIIESPEWWRKDLDEGAALIDPNILFKIQEKCAECEKAWKESVMKKGSEVAQSEKK